MTFFAFVNESHNDTTLYEIRKQIMGIKPQNDDDGSDSENDEGEDDEEVEESNLDLEAIIKELEALSRKRRETQIFIEAPYRNNQLIKDLLNSLNPGTSLCIACDLTMPNQFLQTKSVAECEPTKSSPAIPRLRSLEAPVQNII